MLNPYDEEFSCPYTDKGACQSATQAYETSLQENSGSGAPKASGGSKLVSRKKPTFASPFGPSSASARILGLEPVNSGQARDLADEAKQTFKTLSYNKLNRLLKDPQTPLIAPQEVIRVLLLPRVEGEEEEVITMSRFAYLIVRPSRWVLQDPFVQESNNE
ncbi:MAG: hypothetical protein A2600_09850 [Candidatus Lambdaproteobacteria bacterium RIFOXYD1_FULL_56_27]|uniref:Type IV conjugative transfer system protein TraV n=1 Tax=Candidatus Lambdaproteobacteria bacterium RIFOXYD2_FULL_56_26 TaxID=1817773 RepID=A0A1F6GUC2_9PROT|nr:MAG: hypothetical protein A2557_11840 [Candidatus Lambdaproteobacteria bacterium RIFOXYD2_FULL_56_26]OGH04321.1 MAG: hypothetical protein A2426_05705 [Candidatus Lambdaproteobacteria bacterium RIFOXYC1_FULL_56_13]OGH07383.1 MAG: hypothetical protein A2600_09850 [Candidatus Lambdaproteobacteria bacterium RIFOXYD1_FULL_56_27]